MLRLFSFLLFVIVLAMIVDMGLDDDPVRVKTKPEATSAAPVLAPVGATLLPGLDGISRDITHRNPEVQRWFNQGLALTFGFNHDAAERSFLKATELEPDCAMCWWGAALVLGPHVNAAMDPANNGKAWTRSQKALELSGNATASERGYIEALTHRYAEKPAEDRSGLDEAYAAAMGKLAGQFPDDLDAATLHAEALMNLQPWDYYDQDQRPKGRTLEIVAELESVIGRKPDHAGALHLYIHAVENSTTPERGAAAADRLRALLPGAGHLVHMPAHIYARVGRYHDASLANINAIESDDAYLAACNPAPGMYPLGYVPHNHHFLWWSSTMAGDSAQALAAAAETYNRTADPELLRSPGFEFLHDFQATPLKARVAFGQWTEISTMKQPPEEMPYLVAIWHYAQGMAAIRLSRPQDAQAHLDALKQARGDRRIEQIYVGPKHSLIRPVIVAERVLAGELALARQDYPAAIAALTEAVAEEDANAYTEPPLWHQPARLNLGAALIDAGKPAEAEAVFRQDLEHNRGNPWSLYGLAQSLELQGKPALEVHDRFRQAWAHADITLSAARF